MSSADQLVRTTSDRMRRVLPALVRLRPVERFDELASDVDANRRDQHTDRKGHAPAPAIVTRLGERKREQKADQAARQASEVLAGQLPARKQHPSTFRRRFQYEHRGGADLAADREALKQSRKDQENRRPDADCRIAWRRRDHAAADRHQGDRQGHRRLASGAVSIGAEDRSAERARDEADAECRRRSQIADQRIVGRKEGLTDQTEKGGVDGEVEELEAVAQHGGENALRPDRPRPGRCLRIGCHRPPPLAGSPSI